MAFKRLVESAQNAKDFWDIDVKDTEEMCRLGFHCPFLDRDDISEQYKIAHFKRYPGHYSRPLCVDDVKCTESDNYDHTIKYAHSIQEVFMMSICRDGAECEEYWEGTCLLQHNLTPFRYMQPDNLLLRVHKSLHAT